MVNKIKEARRLLKLKDKVWAANVKNNFNNACAVCGAKKGDFYTNKQGQKKKVILNSHHIIPREIPEMRHDEWNGICLCVRHHKYSTEISAHKNSFAFYTWLKEVHPNKYDYLKLKEVELARNAK